MSPNRRSSLADIALIAGIIILGIVSLFLGSGGRLNLTTSSPTEAQSTVPPVPITPVPTELPPRITPTALPDAIQPAIVAPEPTEVIPPAPPAATPNPSDPYQLTIFTERETDIKFLTAQSAIIAIGRVSEVLPARWTTPDGSRPANPWAPDNKYTIYTPVRIEIERYLKGQGAQTSLALFALGGIANQDSVQMGSDKLNSFQPGERALVFLSETTQLAAIEPSWGIIEHYTQTNDGQFNNGHQTIDAQQLIKEIEVQHWPVRRSAAG